MAIERPIIGITTGTRLEKKTGDPFGRLSLRMEYVEAVTRAGGACVVVPPGTDGIAVASALDGLLLTGGNDLDSRIWGEEPHPANDYEDPRRYAIEVELLKAVRPGMPVFGICYGAQCLNVIHGGSCIQHVPDVVGHTSHGEEQVQDYRVEPGTLLSQVLGSQKATGVSNHHQAVGRLAPGLRVSAWHADGTVEAIEAADDRWLLAVQWHPERSTGETTEKLFAAFVAAASRFKEGLLPCASV